MAAGVAVAGALTIGVSHDTPPSVRSHGSHPATAAGHGHRATLPAVGHGHGATVPPAGLAPTAPTAYTATYSAPSSRYTVAIGASALCWVMATQPATGKVVWTGTVAAGQSQSLSASGTLVVRLGAPSDASVTIDGRPIQLPTGYRSPFDLTFNAGA